MAVTKEILDQYINDKKAISDLNKRIEYLEKRIPKIEKRIAEIEEGHTVKDKVRGGEGGLQSFVIEGVPYDEWNNKKAELEFKKKALMQRKQLLQTEEMALLLKTNEVEKFISGIKDTFIRTLIRYRVLDALSWSEVAKKMGGGNTENGVKMIYYRYFEKK